MDTEKKNASVEMIEYCKPKETAYGKALTMNWFGKTIPDNSTTTIGAVVSFIALIGAIFSGIVSIMIGIIFALGPSFGASALAWPALFVTSLVALHICACATGRANKKLLADPTENFNWQIAKAVKSFNDRAISFNAILAAVQLGKANVPEDELTRVYGELTSAREELDLNIKMLGGMWQMPNTKPELAANLEELRDVKEVVMCELRQSEYPDKALPAGKIREALQNERAYRELPLLSEAKK